MPYTWHEIFLIFGYEGKKNCLEAPEYLRGVKMKKGEVLVI